MAVVMVLELPGATTEQYDRINEIMGVSGPEDEPDALISHVCGKTDDGLVICDVWRSREELDDFINSRVMPAMQEVGAPQPKVTFAELHYQLGTR